MDGAVSQPLMVYGATGYTGRLIVARLLERGIRPVLAGRDEVRVAALAAETGLEHRSARLDDEEKLRAALAGVRVLLHAAGPYSVTARPMLAACLAARVHYLDVTAEVKVLDDLSTCADEARRRGIMVMPAVGFDVVPSDCLAAHIARRLPGASRLALAISGLALVTRGSAKTFLQGWDRGFVRRDGALQPTPLGALRRDFDFGAGPRTCLNMSWGDVVTAYYTTGIPAIETYCEANPALESVMLASRTMGWAMRTPGLSSWLGWLADNALPEGPSEVERARVEMILVAEATDAAGHKVRARLRTPEAYSFTGVTAAAVAARVLAGDLELGFQTPARVYGPDFVCGFDRVHREDLD